MKAARFHAAHDVRIETVPTPIPQKNQLLVSIEWCGICGSDLHEYTTGPHVIPTEKRPHPITKSILPVTMGHEFCGRVLEIPDSCTTTLKPGDAVMVDPRLWCNACHPCSLAATNACSTWGFLGISGGGGGGLSETVAVDADMCHSVSEGMLPYAALIEPLVVSWHGASRLGLETFESIGSILIIGGGPIGLTLALVLRARGATKIYISEPTATRRAQAAEIADRVFNPLEQHLGDEMRALTGGKGVEVVFDCAGSKPGLEAALNGIAFRGQVVNIAGWGGPLELPQLHVMFKEISYKGSLSYDSQDFLSTVEAFNQGKFENLDKLVTSRVALEDVVAKGFEELLKNKDGQIKIMVTPKPALLAAA